VAFFDHGIDGQKKQKKPHSAAYDFFLAWLFFAMYLID